MSERKSDDHVFNKGVKKFYYDIIKEYFEEEGITRFHDGIHTPKLYEICVKDNYWPLPRHIVDLIDQMKVPGEIKVKPDDNSVLFGEGKRCLVKGVISTLSRVINIIKDEENDALIPQLNELKENLIHHVRKYYTHEEGVQREEDGFYVDPEAKKRWIGQREDRNEQFKRCRDSIRGSFCTLVGAKEKDPKKWFIYILAEEVLHLLETPVAGL